MDESVYELMLTHVPQNMLLNGTNARQYLREKIDAINEGQTNSIKTIDDQICTKLAYRSQGIQDNDIVTSYNNWVENSFDQNHLKQINGEFPTMKSKFDNWQQTFKADLTAATALRGEIKTSIYKTAPIFLSVTKLPVKAAEITETKLDPALDAILAGQYRLIKKLESMSDTLSKYNSERMKWVEFLIGMRDTLDSDPKPVELIPKKKKRFLLI